MDYIEKIKECISDLEEEGMLGYIEKLLEVGEEPIEIVNRALIPGIENVGALYQEGEYFIPELLYGLEIMNQGMDMLLPYISKSQTRRYGNVVIGTVEGDTHDIGKNLVKIMMETAGFEMHDLGRDVPAEEFVNQAEALKAQLVCISTLMTTTMSGMEDIIELLKERGIRDNVKVMVGGSPVSKKYADDIGADGYSVNAVEAVRVAKELLNIA